MALMDNVPEGITISDLNGTIHRISRHGVELRAVFKLV
jgi:hypothetical protein